VISWWATGSSRATSDRQAIAALVFAYALSQKNVWHQFFVLFFAGGNLPQLLGCTRSDMESLTKGNAPIPLLRVRLPGIS
jgi:hypothetical protein